MRSARSRIFCTATALLVVVPACACAGQTGDRTASESAAGANVPLAAIVDGQVITVDELDAWIREDLFRRELGSPSAARLYEVRGAAIDRMIDERLLLREASSRGIDPGALLEAEVKARGPVSDEEVEQFYNENKDRFKGSRDPEELKPRIRTHLERLRPGEVLADFRSTASVTIELEPPRTTVAGTGPSRGPANAPVVIVEFSDYQCPFCRRAEPTLNELLERYPTEVRWEYRHYPLPNHPLAKPAAEAAVCAEAQGQFWEFHEKLFSQERSLDASGLRAYAEDIGLDMARFETCQDAPDTRERVAADQRAGKRAGAAGTPAFFVNGVFLTGARPLEDFEKLIRAELARASQTGK